MLVYALAIGVVAMGSSVSAYTSASVSTQRRAASDFDSTTTTASIQLPGTHEMHPLEDPTSWDLHMGRRKAQQQQQQANTSSSSPPRRFLQKATAATASISASASTVGITFDADDRENDDDDNDDHAWKLPFKVEHKKPKNHIPFAGGDTTHGIMIDAGSQGTRLHIYEWEKRFLLDEDDLVEQSEGKLLSYPTSNNRWTDKYTPGLDAFGVNLVDNPDQLEEAVGNYLGALLDFAKEVLRDKKDEWHTYPIYLKATGGLRTLPQPQRIQLLDCVRKLFRDKSFNPFDFENERARVISGEEEAIYGWVGVNFAKGVLIDNSKGSGIGKDPKLTYGMLEMGGASTQIANFENNGDVMANLFKLQLGGSRHWNVYVHSYLYFGINGAWSRLNAHLYWEDKHVNPCLPLGSSIEFDSWMHMNENAQIYPRSDPNSTPYSVTMVNNRTAFDYEDCSKHTNDLLRKRTNHDWCDFQMDGNCGFAGIYQPPIPKVENRANRYIATSNFADVYQFLRLEETSYVSQIGDAAEYTCDLTWEELKVYNSENVKPIKTENDIAQMCFRSVFVYQLVRHGWEFADDFKLTAVDVIDGQKMGWALGCMLYEINTLPWKFHPELLYMGPSRALISLYIALGTLAGSAAGFMIAMRFSKSFNKTVRQSMYFRNHTELVRNPVVRKSLSLPGIADIDELNDPVNERMSLFGR